MSHIAITMRRLLRLWPSLVLLVAGTAAAQSAGTYDLRWSTLDNGGGSSSGGSYSLAGTIGQADAASSGTASSGATYSLAPGYWPGVQSGGAATDALFGDGFE